MGARQKFSSQADAELIARMREAARVDGRYFQAVLEEAMREYLDRRDSATPRERVLAHFRTSVERNRRLGELLSK